MWAYIKFMYFKASVRLHNPSTGNFIGEVFYAKHVDQNTMQFELVKRAGLRLRVTERGTVGRPNVESMIWIQWLADLIN